jgi:hypothetical protein
LVTTARREEMTRDFPPIRRVVERIETVEREGGRAAARLRGAEKPARKGKQHGKRGARIDVYG